MNMLGEFWSPESREKWKDYLFHSEGLWRHLLTESVHRYLLKFIWNLFCLITTLFLYPSDGIYLFHPYMVKMWTLATAAGLLFLIYFFYYFGDGNSQHTIWSIARLSSVRQAWGGAGVSLLLFRLSILVDLLLHFNSRLQSPLIILLDVTSPPHLP
jgi:hypothetical protein